MENAAGRLRMNVAIPQERVNHRKAIGVIRSRAHFDLRQIDSAQLPARWCDIAVSNSFTEIGTDRSRDSQCGTYAAIILASDDRQYIGIRRAQLVYFSEFLYLWDAQVLMFDRFQRFVVHYVPSFGRNFLDVHRLEFKSIEQQSRDLVR